MDLPTPPLPLTMPITFFTLLSGCGFSRKDPGSLSAQFELQLEQS
jgi:hypothetical protein